MKNIAGNPKINFNLRKLIFLNKYAIIKKYAEVEP